MSQNLKKPLKPFVTLDEAFAFQAESKETWTISPLVNAVLEAMNEVRPNNLRNVAKFLDIDERGLSAALRIATGYTYQEFRYHLILRRLELLREEHDHIVSDKIAQQLGFVDRTGLSKFLLNERTQEALRNSGPSRHAKPCPGRSLFGC